MLAHTSRPEHAATSLNSEKLALDKRLATLFWPLLLILIGTIWLIPVGRVPGGTFLIGIGVILLALNLVRVLNGIPLRMLPTLLGVLALAAGLAQIAGAVLPLMPLSLIAIGTSIALELFHSRKT
jgi:NADH:ubiquinone oxidoreductase subunit K